MAKASGRSAAVVGGGWAGCAAAVELARAGHRVTLFEAGRVLGGRARRVQSEGRELDNGQHILLGAYNETLRLLALVGVDRARALLTLPLQMRYPPNSGGMDFIAPRWPAPLHLAWALLRASGLAAADKLALARFSSTARWMGWQLYNDCSVSELLQRFGQTERLTALMWRPLCLAALNTAPERASARVFLAVLRDSLGARRSASDMLLPKRDLSALFPDAAAAYVTNHGGSVHTGATVASLHQQDRRWRVGLRAAPSPEQDDDPPLAFDAVVLATPAGQALLLLAPLPLPDKDTYIDSLTALEAEAITTCYLQYDVAVRLAQPFFALLDAPQAGHWGQFVFDRGQLDAGQAGLLAVVISASGAAVELAREELAHAVAAQLAAVFRRPALAQPLWCKVISEKRATFACTPGLRRPPNATGLPGLALAGDYTAGEYPATIEAAVRSGVQAAAGLFS